MNKFFPEVNKNFGFGCMRFPTAGGKIDEKQVCEMFDLFLKSGFNYFDTAHGYHRGLSEKAIKNCLTSRYPRSAYVLTDKLTDPYFNKREDIRPFFMRQLQTCGAEYFDFYLMHAQNATNYEKFKRCKAYETAFELKKEGYIRHVGISFHDSADVLDRILTEYPQIEVVQIQYNYVDYDDPGVQSRLCYETCVRHGKPVIIMEPVKGGTLVKLPPEADKILRDLGPMSNAAYALRFAATPENVFMVLSGMSDMAQVEDNMRSMGDFKPLDAKESAAIEEVRKIILSSSAIPCTACRYCEEGCPKSIRIPDLFADYNAKKIFHDWNSDWYYEIHTQSAGKASDCVKCGKCERICPQKLPIRDLLESVAKSFD